MASIRPGLSHLAVAAKAIFSVSVGASAWQNTQDGDGAVVGIPGEPDPPVTDPQPPFRRTDAGEACDVALGGFGTQPLERFDDAGLDLPVQTLDVTSCRGRDLELPALAGAH